MALFPLLGTTQAWKDILYSLEEGMSTLSAWLGGAQKTYQRVERCEEIVTLQSSFNQFSDIFVFGGVTKMGGIEDSGEGQECLFGARSF